jgi:hypothetical protein
MIEDVFRSARSARRVRSCLLAPTFEDLIAYLAERGYPAMTIHKYVVALEDATRLDLCPLTVRHRPRLPPHDGGRWPIGSRRLWPDGYVRCAEGELHMKPVLAPKT